MRSLTKDEVVHDIGYDDLQFRLLDGVEREQCFREGLGKQRLELGFEFIERLVEFREFGTDFGGVCRHDASQKKRGVE